MPEYPRKSGTYLAPFVIEEVTYKGVFFKQHDEKAKSTEVMTFTAIGTNNETIWGVKCAEGTYINGEQVQTGKDNYKVIMDTFKVATNNYLGGSYYKDPDFCGKMDNVAIYNTCLSAKEVAALAGK